MWNDYFTTALFDVFPLRNLSWNISRKYTLIEIVSRSLNFDNFVNKFIILWLFDMSSVLFLEILSTSSQIILILLFLKKSIIILLIVIKYLAEVLNIIFFFLFAFSLLCDFFFLFLLFLNFSLLDSFSNLSRSSIKKHVTSKSCIAWTIGVSRSQYCMFLFLW